MLKRHKSIYRSLVLALRDLHYRTLSLGRYEGVPPIREQPLLINGGGCIRFLGPCTFGWLQSPDFFNAYAYLEAREPSSLIEFEGGSHFNNRIQIIANTGTIRLGKNLTVGSGCAILNSDFHNLPVTTRNIPPFPTADIRIGDNVFIGNNVTILKGVAIGNDAVIGAGSVVVSDIPERCLAAGNPAKIIRAL